MGSIPIVHRDIAHRDWEDLPIAWLDNWEEITPEWLDVQEARIQTGTFPLEKLTARYWIQAIANT